jgi:hypothetical protein
MKNVNPKLKMRWSVNYRGTCQDGNIALQGRLQRLTVSAGRADRTKKLYMDTASPIGVGYEYVDCVAGG